MLRYFSAAPCPFHLVHMPPPRLSSKTIRIDTHGFDDRIALLQKWLNLLFSKRSHQLCHDDYYKGFNGACSIAICS